MENLMFTTIEVHSLEEIKPSHQMSQATRLKLKISIDRHQLSTLIFDAFNNFKLEDLNEILNQEGINIMYKENND